MTVVRQPWYRKRALLFGLAVMTIALGCADQSKHLKEVAVKTNEFLLGPEDVIDITVWRNQDLSRQAVVRPDGMVTMPLIGDIRASGLTADQLGNRIAERLKEFKEDPRVSVSVKEVNSYYIYVLGEVAKPGKYQLKSYTTVLQGLAMAGGFTRFASRNSIQVVQSHANGDGTPHEVRIRVPYDELLTDKGGLKNFYLKPGDTIVVP